MRTVSCLLITSYQVVLISQLVKYQLWRITSTFRGKLFFLSQIPPDLTSFTHSKGWIAETFDSTGLPVKCSYPRTKHSVTWGSTLWSVNFAVCIVKCLISVLYHTVSMLAELLGIRPICTVAVMFDSQSFVSGSRPALTSKECTLDDFQKVRSDSCYVVSLTSKCWSKRQQNMKNRWKITVNPLLLKAIIGSVSHLVIKYKDSIHLLSRRIFSDSRPGS